MYHLTRKVWEKIIKFSEDGVKFDTKAMIVNVSSLVQTLQDSPWRCYKNSEHAELSHHETFVSECSLSQMEGPPLQIDPSVGQRAWRECLNWVLWCGWKPRANADYIFPFMVCQMAFYRAKLSFLKT